MNDVWNGIVVMKNPFQRLCILVEYKRGGPKSKGETAVHVVLLPPTYAQPLSVFYSDW